MASSAPPPTVSAGSAQDDQTLSSRKETLRRMYEESQKAFPAVSASRRICACSRTMLFCKAATFFQVQDITCNQLQDLLQASDPVILVDVRSPDEQQVSVLPGNVVRKEDFDGHQQEYANHKIVTYWYAVMYANTHFCLATAAQLRIIKPTCRHLSSTVISLGNCSTSAAAL